MNIKDNEIMCVCPKVTFNGSCCLKGTNLTTHKTLTDVFYLVFLLTSQRSLLKTYSQSLRTLELCTLYSWVFIWNIEKERTATRCISNILFWHILYSRCFLKLPQEIKCAFWAYLLGNAQLEEHNLHIWVRSLYMLCL